MSHKMKEVKKSTPVQSKKPVEKKKEVKKDVKKDVKKK